MNYQAVAEAQWWAMKAARAVPGVRWTIQLPETRLTYWTDVEGAEHISATRPSRPKGF